MTKKRRHVVQHVCMGWFLARSSSMLVLVPLSLLLLILCTACGSTSTSTTSPTTSVFHTTLQTTDKTFTVQITITPNTLGNNTFTVTIISPSQQDLKQPIQVNLQTTMLDMAMGTDSVTLQSDTKGNYSGQGTLTMNGNWQIRVVIHTPDHVLHEGQFQAKLA